MFSGYNFTRRDQVQYFCVYFSSQLSLSCFWFTRASVFKSSRTFSTFHLKIHYFLFTTLLFFHSLRRHLLQLMDNNLSNWSNVLGLEVNNCRLNLPCRQSVLSLEYSVTIYLPDLCSDWYVWLPLGSSKGLVLSSVLRFWNVNFLSWNDLLRYTLQRDHRRVSA